MIAILFLIFVSSVLIFSFVIFQSGTLESIKLISDQQKARDGANACAEEALIIIASGNYNYVGAEDKVLGGLSCRIVAVINTGTQSRIIQTQSTVGNITKKIKVTTLTYFPQITISSWREVVSF